MYASDVKGMIVWSSNVHNKKHIHVYVCVYMYISMCILSECIDIFFSNIQKCDSSTYSVL